jgi:superoxide dismutase, Fe-Mn family
MTDFPTSELQYDFDALEPLLSRETVLHHLFQHHRECYERTASLVKGTELESLSLESLVRVSATQPGYTRLFHAAAEAWNHDLYWQSLRPGGGGAAYGLVGDCIRRSFGSFPRFLHRAKKAAAQVMGCGWLWITSRGGNLEIVTTANANTPMVRGQVPLLAIDLWEHAYYLDYRSGRAEYVSACLEGLMNWDLASEQLMRLEAKLRRPRLVLARDAVRSATRDSGRDVEPPSCVHQRSPASLQPQ